MQRTMAEKPSWTEISANTSKKARLQALFQHIGSEERLEAILSVFYQRLSGDLLVGFFFTGKDLGQIAKMQAAFLLKAMGVRPTYPGKLPTDAHKAIPPILKGHFDRRLIVLREVLNEQELAPEFVEVWIEFEEAFRTNVVQD